MNLLRLVCLLAFGALCLGSIEAVAESAKQPLQEQGTVSPHPNPLLKEERERVAWPATSQGAATFGSLAPRSGERAGVRGKVASPTIQLTQSPAPLQRFDFSGPGMFTTFRISCYAENREQAEKAVEACFQRIAELNQIFTDYDPTSELMRLCAPEARHPVQVSPALYDLLDRSVHLGQVTDGAFDITCGHLSQLWRRSKRQNRLPPTKRLEAGIAATDWRRIQLQPDRRVTLQPGTLLDVGGIAKGYAADECLKILQAHGLPCAIVLAGGDTSAGDAPPGKPGWEVKLRTFTRAEEDDDLEVLHLAHRAVSTSGDLYQSIEIEGQRYSHILSPKTGLGLTQRIACSVIAPDCTTSDALATAMCVMGVEKGTALAKTLPGVEVRFAEKK